MYLILIPHITQEKFNSKIKKKGIYGKEITADCQEQFLFHHSYREERCGMHLTLKNHTYMRVLCSALYRPEPRITLQLPKLIYIYINL
jgi:hypothetical protein